MSVLRIDHVQLPYPPGGETAAIGFYRDVLGFTQVEKPAAMAVRGGLWFEAGPVGVHLGVEPDMRPSTKMHPAFVVDNLRALVEALRAAGHQWKANDELPGIQRGHTVDPFGNRIELIAG